MGACQATDGDASNYAQIKTAQSELLSDTKGTQNIIIDQVVDPMNPHHEIKRLGQVYKDYRFGITYAFIVNIQHI